MSLSPIIVDNGSFLQFIFSHELIPKDVENIDEEELERKLLEFLKEAHSSYYSSYTSQPEIARSARQIDLDALMGMVLSRYESLPEQGRLARLYVIAFMQKSTPNNPILFPIIGEHLQYSLHFHEKKDKVIEILPVGYQLVHSVRNLDIGPASTIILDSRVSTQQVEDAKTWLEKTAIPQLEAYMNYHAGLFTKICEKPYTIDNEAVLGWFEEIVISHYEHRLDNPNTTDRRVFRLETVYSGDTQETSKIEHRICVEKQDTETPFYAVTAPEYKASKLSDPEILKTFTCI